jgi:hypothetical protein
VVATSEGWLVSGRTGGSEAVSTVETLWTSVLRGSPGAWPPGLPGLFASLQEEAAGDIAWRVLALGKQLSRELAGASGDEPSPAQGSA